MKIKKNTQSMQLSSILHSPIFSTSNYKIEAQERTLVSYQISRTKNERIIYNGLELNTSDDFPLFAIIMSKYQQTKNFKVVLYENDLFDALRISLDARKKTKKEVIRKRLKRLEMCNIELLYYDESNSHEIDSFTTRLSFSLFESTFYDLKSGEITVNLNGRIGDVATADFSKELIDLTVFYKIKTQYAKATYLFLQTKKFKKQKYFYLSLDEMIERFGHSKMVKREKKRKLKIALEQLVTLNHIGDFEFLKDDGVEKVKIINKKKKVN
ncbi:hypothetical protein [Shewanella algae]|uniref:hypothetical protein n=1 Tax=Shewanella algae TaxID=38313 RepID=UPI001183599B|nr:hypothetical protein [Shewanella algae]TVP08474.1 hypothetical protein AYI73_01010 [Shewanella algae]